MEAIPKFLASAFVIIFAVVIGISLLLCGSSIVSARNFYTNVADAIGSVEEVYEDDVIAECSLLAEENGYVLKTEKAMTEDSKYFYKVVLEYKFIAPFFGKAQTGTVSGYVYPGVHVNVS